MICILIEEQALRTEEHTTDHGRRKISLAFCLIVTIVFGVMWERPSYKKPNCRGRDHVLNGRGKTEVKSEISVQRRMESQGWELARTLRMRRQNSLLDARERGEQ
ncbi:hypothetical protein LshimejAT787_0603780 [Lyophyllum shimeji]|uniref:Transmembrane protein n=1 Tax=Lyophyllum shimeji TaxID=47721 RepID=A0A9P3PP57_LYOSH|nr:hypothetical protein LshimejAT787_0603780 [Lyophyllum shimeji]